MSLAELAMKAIGATAFGALVLQQADSAIWYHFCVIKSVRTNLDPGEIYKNGRNKFLVSIKVIPATIALIGFFWGMMQFQPMLVAVILCFGGVISFVSVSIWKSLTAFREFTGLR